MFSFYQDRFKGGVTTGGWSPPRDLGGTGSFIISISNATSIRQAYLLVARCGTAEDIVSAPVINFPVVLDNGFNSHTYILNSSNQASPNFNTVFQTIGTSSGIHAVDVTADISTSATNYTITIPNQSQVNSRYTDFCLYIAWNDLSADIIDACIFLNDQNMSSIMSFPLSFMIPMDISKPVGLGLFTGYICNNNITGSGNHDPSNVSVNSILLGYIGSTTGDGQCGGAWECPRGNFKYSNSALTALANCNINQAMSGEDCLSDIKALLPANCTALTIDVATTEIGNNSNNFWGAFVTYTDNQPYAFPYECLACIPSGITATNITNNAVDINWCPQGGIVNYANNVQYRIVGNTVWTVVPTLNVNTLHIAGLTTLTSYEYQIVNTDSDGAVCAPSVIKNFTTL